MKHPVSSSSSVLSKFHLSPYLYTLLTFIAFVVILYGEDFSGIFSQKLDPYWGQSLSKTDKAKLPFAIGENGGGCDVFSGRWVRDELTRPLYEESSCPYIDQQVTCQEHGRPEKEYQYWRWQPHACSLPSGGTVTFMGGGGRGFSAESIKLTTVSSFNATLLLETLRGKRMMFVGDSLNKGQYMSMVCLLHSIIPEHAKSIETFDSLTVFRAKDYNATIEFYWAPLLLEFKSEDPVNHRTPERLIKKDSIDRHGQHWTGVDILVFNTYVWWTSASQKLKILEGSFNDEVKNIVEMTIEDAYGMAMKSLLKWVKKNMDPKNTRVFFTSMSPFHRNSTDWGGEPGGNCYNQTTLIEDPAYWALGSRKSIMQMIGEMFKKSEVPITFLNITQLSCYRKDAHPSIYKKRWTPLTPEQIANPVSYTDCVHWCIPGLQDTWNELLFTKLFYP